MHNMSFDQDPNEQANISGADLAILIDEIKELKRQLSEAKRQAVPEWQPIETAPKDETEILIYTIRGNCYVVSYDDLLAAPWRIRNDKELYRHAPTHWMPLPAAPQPHKD